MNSVFSEYRTEAASGAWFGHGLKATINTSPEPFIYSNWIGRAIHGQIDNMELDVTLVGIEANGQIYLLQMLAPRAEAWDASLLLAQLARSLTFDHVGRPGQSQTSGAAGCSGCFQSGMEHMQNMTSTTVKGMK